MSINVLHIDTERTWRGGEQQAFWLIEGLLRRNAGRQAAVGQPGGQWCARCRKAGVETFDISMRGAWDLAAARRIGALARREGFDLLHAHTSHAHSLAWLGGALPGKVPVVATRRVDFALPRGPFSFLRRAKYLHPRVRIIAISEGVKKVLADGGVPIESIAVVPSGIDPKRLDASHDREKLRRELGISPETALIGNVAALTDHKGQIYLVRAADALRRSEGHYNFVVAIIGEGEERARLESEIASLHLEKHVTLTGWRGDIPDCLAAFDLYCMPSHLEGLGTSMLDAMYKNLPVAASRTGGITDAIRDGENGLLFPPRDPAAIAGALARLLDDAELRSRLARQAKLDIEARFTVDRMVEGNIAIYKSFLEEQRRSP